MRQTREHVIDVTFYGFDIDERKFPLKFDEGATPLCIFFDEAEVLEGRGSLEGSTSGAVPWAGVGKPPDYPLLPQPWRERRSSRKQNRNFSLTKPVYKFKAARFLGWKRKVAKRKNQTR